MPSTSKPVIRFHDVVKRFGEITAVDHMTFSVCAGETVSLLGPSGCGKTTTLRLVSGFEEPDAGIIEIAGESMTGKRPYERNVGLLFQNYALFPHMTVSENVAYGLKHRGWPKTTIPSRVREMLQLVQLQGFEARRPSQMSGGQQQRVALARVLATQPKLVLLDEPLSALDAKLREQLRLELKQILSIVGSTTIVVTHDQEEAMSLANRIIVMNRGRIEQEGSPHEIYMRPRTVFVADFIGRANWFHGSISDVLGDGLFCLITEAGTKLVVRLPNANEGENWSVCVRPERIVVAGPETTGARPDDNAVPARVVDVVSMGAEFHYVIECLEGRVIVVEPNRAGPRVHAGDPIRLLFHATDCVVLPRNAV
jgi:putative spermidine/putrescine transport system ATP-binding protein/putrescine transport system ATP-binding protein